MIGERRAARSVAFQTLFELESRSGRSVEEILERRAATAAEDLRQVLSRRAIRFAQQLVEGTLAKRESIDEYIQRTAHAFPVQQMAITDRVALEIGLFEMLYAHTASASVIINEAVEMAKVYGGENSGRFVNGVLGTIAEGLSTQQHDAGDQQVSLPKQHSSRR